MFLFPKKFSHTNTFDSQAKPACVQDDDDDDGEVNFLCIYSFRWDAKRALWSS